MYFTFTVFFLLIFHTILANKQSYYENLIKTNIAKASNWKNPTKTIDFENYKRTDCKNYGKFDFIIIGAGPAGCVLANRLSANGTFKVLLLEAGDDENNFSLIPGAYVYGLNSSLNWGFQTTSQENACGEFPNNRCPYNSGKALGGSSAINGMGYIRSNRFDFDNWIKPGNNGWSYNEVLPYFMKSENFVGPNGDKGYHGSNGPVTIDQVRIEDPVQEILAETISSFGNFRVDFNGKEQIGFGVTQHNIRNGVRASTNQAYLKPIKSRKNLVILTKALASLILYRKTMASGTKFLYKGRCWYALSKREVIVSAGVIKSPQLLQLSGIGPRLELPELHIKVDLPVGKNFQDHVCLSKPILIKTNFTKKVHSIEEEVKRYLNSEGILTKSVSDFISFHGTNDINENINKPDFEVTYQIVPERTLGNEKEGDYSRIQLQLVPIVQYPHSVGFVKVKSMDPLEYPLINPNLLDKIEDKNTLKAAIRYILRYLDSDQLKKMDPVLIPHLKCNHLDFKDDEDQYIECVMKNYGYNCLHASGTCRMGSSKENSVVQNNFKVHSFRNLRVVDGSIIPSPVSGHYFATILMIAEKAADIILEEHLK